MPNLDEMNKEIGYKKGEIYREWNGNYNSELWNEVEALGWEMEISSNGRNVDIFDKDGEWVVSEVGMANALKSLAIFLR